MMRFVRAGQTLPVRGQPKGVIFTREALLQGVADGLFDGRAVFFTHVLDGGRDVRDLAGVTANSFYNEETDSVDGEVFLYHNTAGTELDVLVADFRRHRFEGIPQPDVGISIDAFFVFEPGPGASEAGASGPGVACLGRRHGGPVRRQYC